MEDVFNKACVCPRMIVVDGIGRSGKMCLAKLISNFDAVDAFQASYIAEEFLGLRHLEKIDDSTLKGFLHLIFDSLIYNRIIGRDLNTRFSDSSSIYRSSDPEEYIRRSVSEEGPKAIERFDQKARIPCFLTHNALMNFDVISEIIPSSQMVFIARHPIDVVYSWFKRLGTARYGTTAWYLTLAVESEHGPMPWWMAGTDSGYLLKGDVDRVVLEIARIWELTRKRFEAFPENLKRRIYPMTYEDLFSKPMDSMRRLAAFLGLELPEQMESVLMRERVWPTGRFVESRERKLEEIRASASIDIMKTLEKMSLEYEAAFETAGLVGRKP